MTVNERDAPLRRLAPGSWLLLIASIVAWPFCSAGIGFMTTAIAVLPLLLPMPGLVRTQRRTLQWSPLTLAPALALALTEILVNAPARIPATLTLALIFTAFAITVAALRKIPRSG
ncbi:MAG: DUF2069 domain-containing protein [Steroidobacteraceae bacterium]